MKIIPMGKSVCILASEREELSILCNFGKMFKYYSLLLAVAVSVAPAAKKLKSIRYCTV